MRERIGQAPRTEFLDFLYQTQPGLIYSDKGGVGIWQSPLYREFEWIRHGYSTRKGGVSEGHYASMNLSLNRTYGLEETLMNFALYAHAVGVDLAHAVLVDGVHGAEINRVGPANWGEGFRPIYPPGTIGFDGMVTNEEQVVLTTIHADCTPLFAVDPVHRAIGLCHAGWRGTALGIGSALIQRMQQDYGSDPQALLLMIGPNLATCCFEVHEDVAQQFLDAFPGFGGVYRAALPGKFMVDLTAAMAFQLMKAGAVAQNVNIAHLCTGCNETLFHSYRRNGVNGGSQASMLAIV